MHLAFHTITLFQTVLQVTMDDFELACKGLYRALTIREKYMKLAFQRFPNTPSEYLRKIEGEQWKPEDLVVPGNVYQNTMIKKRFNLIK